MPFFNRLLGLVFLNFKIFSLFETSQKLRVMQLFIFVPDTGTESIRVLLLTRIENVTRLLESSANSGTAFKLKMSQTNE